MNKLILHNFSLPYAKTAPGFFNIDQSGIFFAEAGDVMLTREAIPDEQLDFLDGLGFPTKKIEFVIPRTPLPATNSSIFEDPKLKAFLLKLFKSTSSKFVLDSFMLTPSEANWAAELGVAYVGKPEDYYIFGNKSNFRRLMRKWGFNIPLGFSNRRSHVDGAIAASLVFLTGASEVVVKQDEGVAGLGSTRFKINDLLQNLDLLHNLFPAADLSGIQPTKSRGFVVEKWYQNVTCSPSLQFYIDVNGTVSLLSSHLQVFTDNGMQYQGCCSAAWLLASDKLKLNSEGIKIARKLAEEGYVGHGAFNAVVLEDGRILWVELNPRRVMSSYPYEIVTQLSKFTEDNLDYKTITIQKNAWVGKAPGKLLSEIKPILYNRRFQSGVILVHYHLLESLGEATFLVVGRNKNEVEYVFRGLSAF